MPYARTPTAVQITLASGNYQLYQLHPLGAAIYIGWTVLSTLLLLSLLVAMLSYDFEVRTYGCTCCTTAGCLRRALRCLCLLWSIQHVHVEVMYVLCCACTWT